MEEKKPCVRCERPIDPFARICPFCNWEQELPPPKETPASAAIAEQQVVDAAGEEKRQRRRRVLMAVGIAALLLATFAIGSFIARLGRKPMTPQEDTPSAVQTQARRPTQITDLRLVPVDLTSTVGGSITSVPQQPGVPAVPGASDHPDATALPSQQYYELVRRTAQQQPASPGTEADTLDPRTIVAPPIPQIRRPPPSRPPSALREEARGDEEGSGGARTRPVPLSQPLPDINASGTAKFRLRIGADGSVKEVDVLQSIPGATPRLIAAIQRWKFRPATENGRPVEGIHLVDISFKDQDD